MIESNNIEGLAGKIVRGLIRSVSPQNAAKPPTQTVVQPQGASPGNQVGAGRSSYRGASQSGTWDGMEQAAPLSAEAKAQLHPKIVRQPRYALEGVPHQSPEQEPAFSQDLLDEGYCPSKAVVRALEAEDPKYVRITDAILEVVRSQGPAHTEHTEGFARAVAEGDPSALERDTFTREELEQEKREQLHALKSELRRVTDRAWATAEPELLRKAEIARNRAIDLDATARLIFDKFSTPYKTPSYVLAYLKYAESLSNGSRRNAGLPSQMLETI
jgi:hypothetical protein